MPQREPVPVSDAAEASADFHALAGLAWYAQRKPVFTGGNRVQLLQGGRDLFPALTERIDAAQDSVWLALYIVSPLGQSGGVLQALMRAARRGVQVHMVVDGLGSRTAPGARSRTVTVVSPLELVRSGFVWSTPRRTTAPMKKRLVLPVSVPVMICEPDCPSA